MEQLKAILITDKHLNYLDAIHNIRILIRKKPYNIFVKYSSGAKEPIRKELQGYIDNFFDVAFISKERYLLDLLEIKPKKKKPKKSEEKCQCITSQFQDAIVLAFLLADIDLTNKAIADYSGHDSQRVGTTRRELKNNIETHRKEVADYAESHPTSFAVLLLLIADSAIKEGANSNAK